MGKAEQKGQAAKGKRWEEEVGKTGEEGGTSESQHKPEPRLCLNCNDFTYTYSKKCPKCATELPEKVKRTQEESKGKESLGRSK